MQIPLNKNGGEGRCNFAVAKSATEGYFICWEEARIAVQYRFALMDRQRHIGYADYRRFRKYKKPAMAGCLCLSTFGEWG